MQEKSKSNVLNSLKKQLLPFQLILICSYYKLAINNLKSRIKSDEVIRKKMIFLNIALKSMWLFSPY